MNEKLFLEELTAILKKVLKTEELTVLTMSTNLLEDPGLNSLSAIETLVHVEEVFDIEVEDDDLQVELIETPQKLWDYVKRIKDNEN
jgi:acyl carrier protein